ncbi:putative histone acetyltransferase transcription factor and/or regulators TAZ family [Rosa chinensis]|uniref:histone acetyltransferase n=1 Tax=Rosa chinensis TaxID=74649 RepID=A0A2P6RZQ3_ROSCH|nr:histone acetyltransferase HAC1-like [Rosa chinensis]PRQ51911.1 putative histone acetyltransferase transcription factor and/or regulators TAZ family [Rosa chinensis]
MLPHGVINAVAHAVRCPFKQCQYPNCRLVYALLLHGSRCQVRVPGGCLLCKKMWLLLYHHALSCKEDECYVPRCRDIREKMRKRLQAERDDEIHNKAAVRAAPGA